MRDWKDILYDEQKHLGSVFLDPVMKLRPYQTKISAEAVEILRNKHIVYLAMEVRTGKSLTALNTAQLYGAKRVLFLTKKKAISYTMGLRQLRVYV